MTDIAVAMTADRPRDEAALAWAEGWGERRGSTVGITRLVGAAPLASVVVAGVTGLDQASSALRQLLDRGRGTISTVVLVPTQATVERRADENDRPIVLGASCSTAGRAALAFAVREAIGETRPLQVVRVWPDPVLTPAAVLPAASVLTVDPVMGERTQRVAATLDDGGDVAVLADVLTRARALRPLLQVSGELRSGDPRHELERAAAEADLLVIGAGRPNGAAAALLGQLACPLVVVGGGPSRRPSGSPRPKVPSTQDFCGDERTRRHATI